MEKLVQASRPIALLVVFVLLCPAQTAQQEYTLFDNQRVVTLSRSLSADELVNLIMSAPNVSFNLSPGNTDALVKAGVSDAVIRAMAARSNGQAAVMPLAVKTAPVVTTMPAAATMATPANPPVPLVHSGNSYKITYDGGSLPNLKAGTGLRLFIDSNQILLEKDHSEVLTVFPASVTEISYGQDVHRRVGAAIGLAVVSFGIGALMALTKSKKHFVGLTWASGEQKGGFAMQCDKSDYRGVLAGLEGVTGKKAVDSDALTVKN